MTVVGQVNEVAEPRHHLAQALSAYVPPEVWRGLANEARVGSRITPCHAVLLFVDISGCSRLARDLQHAGPDGAERFARVLNDTFDPTVQLVTEHGGEVVKFAGDAVLAVWAGTGEASSVVARLRLATQCGRAIIARLHGRTVVGNVRLQLRGAVGFGDAQSGWIRGSNERFESLLCGPVMTDLRTAFAHTVPGTLVGSPAAWSLLRPHCRGRPLTGGCYALDVIAEPLSARRLPSPVPPESVAEHLRLLVPRTVLRFLEADQEAWMAEYRTSTVAFIQPTAISGCEADAAERLEAALCLMQPTVDRLGGVVVQYMVDDKGPVLIAAWGVPDGAFEDNAVRALEASLAIHRDLTDAGLGARIGVSTGRVFNGVRGNHQRREFALIGDAVIRAARLMTLDFEGVRCDGATESQARAHILLTKRPPARLKGFSHAARVFEPRAVRAGRLRYRQNQHMVGRMSEQAIVSEVVSGAVSGRGRTLFIEGDAGVGKSLLAQSAIALAKRRGLHVLYSGSDGVEQAYGAFRDAIKQLLRLSDGLQPEQRVARVNAALSFDPTLAPLAPLLGVVAAVGIPDSDRTRAMDGELRATNLQRLLFELVRRRVTRQPTMLVLEDAHWFDAASWSLIADLRAACPQLLLLLTQRSLTTPAARRSHAALCQREDTTRIQLSDLPRDVTEVLVANALGATEVPCELTDFIHQRTAGHPFFSEQLTHALRDTGYLSVDAEGQVVLPEGESRLHELPLPDTVEAAVASRIDRLDASQQLVLKVASVIGRVFALRLLQSACGEAIKAEDTAREAVRLVEHRITDLHAADPELSYLFRQLITRDVAYGMLPYEQRRALHASIARWFETCYADHLPAHYPTLAHHWSRTEDTERALYYLERAAVQAIEAYAYAEALSLLDQAEALRVERGVQLQDERLARWEYYRGEAHYHLVSLDDAYRHLARSLQLRGLSFPDPGARRGLALGGHVLRQLLHFGAPQSLLRRRGMRREVEKHGSLLYMRMSTLAFYRQDLVGLMLATYGGTNYAEGAGADREMALGYGGLAITYGLFGLHPIARTYNRRSLAAARRDGTLPTLAEAALYSGTYHYPAAHWTEAERDFTVAFDLFRTLGDVTRTDIAAAARGYMWLFRGRYDRANADFGHVLASTGGRDELKTNLWAIGGRLVTAIARDHVRRALVDELLSLSERADIDAGDAVVAHGMVAWSLHHLGDDAGALQHALRVHATMTDKAPTAVYTGFGVCGALRVLVHARRFVHAAQLMRALRVLSMQNPALRPWAQLCEGQLQAAQGGARRAGAAFDKAAKGAVQLGLPEVEARAALGLARLARPASAARRQHAQRAEGRARGIGATGLQAAAAALLGEGDT